jgi:hypothetical protein
MNTRLTDSHFAHDCWLSRLWGGLHFMGAIQGSRKFGPKVGERAYEFVTRHMTGNVAALPYGPVVRSGSKRHS